MELLLIVIEPSSIAFQQGRSFNEKESLAASTQRAKSRLYERDSQSELDT